MSGTTASTILFSNVPYKQQTIQMHYEDGRKRMKGRSFVAVLA
jgi:hypothetical protein